MGCTASIKLQETRSAGSIVRCQISGKSRVVLCGLLEPFVCVWKSSAVVTEAEIGCL